MSRVQAINAHPVFQAINQCLAKDPRFRFRGRNSVGGNSYEMSEGVDLIAPCSGADLDTAKYRINLVEINTQGVEVHIEMMALGINEWETVFWGTCRSVDFFTELLYQALGLPMIDSID